MKQYKIVIVENDEDEQFFIKKEFEASKDFSLLAIVENGNALIQWLADHPDQLPDLILSDLNMPGKNGHDIIKELKSNSTYAAIPVIITSTSSTPTIINQCLSLGAAGYIVKPETFVAYATFVEELLQKVKALPA